VEATVKEVLYDVQWQRLRISLLQSRRDDGGWSTREGMFENLRRLDRYLFDKEIVPVERTVRKYRINNCLNAVVMGYNGQGADQYLMSTVRGYRQDNAAGFNTTDVRKKAASWQWDAQLKQLIMFRQDDEEEFKFLHENLKHRFRNGNRQSRPELFKFLELMKTAART
jgi:hypothetical protein